MFLEVNRIKRISGPRHLLYQVKLNIAIQNGYAKQNIIQLHFLAKKNHAANYQELGKKEKPFAPRILSVRMQNWAQQDKA